MENKKIIENKQFEKTEEKHEEKSKKIKENEHQNENVIINEFRREVVNSKKKFLTLNDIL